MRCATRQLRWKKRNIYCYKLSSKRLNQLFMLHRTVWGVPPASSDELETQHISSKRLSLLFMLHRTVWGVPPASSDEKNATYIVTNRPFAAYSHMVQKPPCWDARDALGQDKQRTYIIYNGNLLCLFCPRAFLASQHGGFCTMWL